MAKLISRRSMMAVTGVTIASAAGGRVPRPRPFFERHGLPIGIQLYTVKDELDRDLDGTLSRLASIGYRTVEIAGLSGRTAEELRAALDRAGLRCTGSHLLPRGIQPGPNLEDDAKSIADLGRILGFDLVVMALFYVPRRMSLMPRAGENGAALLSRLGSEMSADDWIRQADFLNERGRALKAVGLQLAYHNHNVELAPMPDGKGRIIDMLLERTDPGAVSFEMDVAWIVAGGGNPLEMLRRHPGRFAALHVKDVSAATKTNFSLQQVPADVGSGIIDWRTILPAAWDAGVRRFYVEQEPPFSRPALDAVRSGYEFLSSLNA